MINRKTLKDAIVDSMNDYFENNGFRPHNPAICRDKNGEYYYGSALNGEAVAMLDDLEQITLTPYWPESANDNFNSLAEGLANETLNQ